ncbi:sigma factor-like helix-turn-helix DNA-binding protein [Flintibacter muris]
MSKVFKQALIYFYGYTSADIAQKFNKSKQNINQIKLRALKKLKKMYDL